MLQRLGHRLVSVALLILLMGTLCWGIAPAQAATHTVKMGSDSGRLVFDPAVLTIAPGDTVRWINNKVPPHNVVFDATKMSQTLADQFSHRQLLVRLGQEVETSFPDDLAPGSYPYYCVPHRGAGMVGTIIVQASDDLA